ncbi:uncharacterized protein LOC129590786 [Paramacrobiotus metropolitanus]|uniref:uncharacterized protein LOC129590786 n=1 Tax=Paramacrobiotus metropolitanus TaxID=2943436 RepID=UPI0024457ABD|nr:uncharacterized protein LOC129590786 [Paramacrobiotus metropolitanus]
MSGRTPAACALSILVPVLICFNKSTGSAGVSGQNASAETGNDTVFVDFGFIIGPQSFHTWFRDATLREESMKSEEQLSLLSDHNQIVREGSPAHFDWLTYNSLADEPRNVAAFSRKLEYISAAVAQRNGHSGAAPETLNDYSEALPKDIKASCPFPISTLPCNAAHFRSFSGECNNVQHPYWGRQFTPFSRTKDGEYFDGVSGPKTQDSLGHRLPSPVRVSEVFRKTAIGDHKYVNQLLPVWAMLLEDDLAQSVSYAAGNGSMAVSCCGDLQTIHPECFPIVDNDRSSCTHYMRSLSAPAIGCQLQARQQMNLASHFLDGSSIYGTSDQRDPLGIKNGLLPMQKGPNGKGILVKPLDNKECEKPETSEGQCPSHKSETSPTSGYAPLAAIKILLMREHNRLANILSTLNRHWNAEKLFQTARKILIAEIQHITFKEYLPILLDHRALRDHNLTLQNINYYNGYRMETDPSASNGFATVGSKLWLTMLDDKILRVHWNNTKSRRLISKDVLQQSEFLENDEMDSYIRGMVRQPIRKHGGISGEVLDDWLQSPEQSFGMNLLSLVIQRERDHGISGYTNWRKQCDLPNILNYEDLDGVMTAEDIAQFKKIFKSVHDIDLIAAAFAEVPSKGSLVGPVLACVIGQQFNSLRHGDRFWYEMDIPPSKFTLNQLNELKKSSLSRLICDNADNLTNIQPEAMLLPDEALNAVIDCRNIPAMDLSKWREQTALFHIDLLSPSNETDPILIRNRRQFGFGGGGFGGGGFGNFRQSRQLQPVNQFQNFQPSDNGCDEKRQGCDATSKFRSISGHCNNLNHPEFGETDRIFSRFLAPQYDDGVGQQRDASAAGGSLPPVRAVRTNILTDVDRPHPKYTVLLMQFGQFIDHDFTNTPMATSNTGGFLSCRECDSQFTVSQECRPIRVPQGDPVMASFDQRGRPLCLSFTRSQSRQGSDGRRQQVNQLSSYLDGGMVYGTSRCFTRRLRSLNNGLLITTRHPQGGKDLLQQSTNQNDVESQECRSVNRANRCFLAGDARSNEQPGLSAMHTVWVREHNRIANELRGLNPHWDDQRVFDETRRILVAVLQHITYNEWIPRVVGQPVANIFGLALKKSGYYNEYDDTCDATISNEFATAAFRFGHSLVPARLGRYDNTFQSNLFKPLNLFEHFSRVDSLYESLGVDQILIGLTIEPTQNADFSFSDALANHLFQDPNRPLGTDLVAINIQRGRDHGLAGYNAYRERCNMTKAKSFDDLLGDIPKFLVDRLAQLYRHVDDIDLFTGGTVELPVTGGLVGPTFACIIGEQFLRLRKCDRFWYENSDTTVRFTPAQLAAIKKVTMAKLVCQNSDTYNQIQRSVFDLPDTFSNTHVSCNDITSLDLSPFQEVSACSVSGKRVEIGESKRATPCVECSCTVNGPDCRSLSVNCQDLKKEFTTDQILADNVCKVQCSKELADDDDSAK